MEQLHRGDPQEGWERMKKGMGIKVKVAITAILFMGILAAAIAIVGYKLYRENVMESYLSYADTVLEYAYRATEEFAFGDMIRERSMPEDYEVLRSKLNQIKDSSKIEYLYAIYFDDPNNIHSLHYAINAKTQAELSTGAPLTEIYSYMGKPCEEGSFAEDTLLTLSQAVRGRQRESRALEGVSEEYGHMLNGYRVLFDSKDQAVGLICVEIDINRINKGLHQYVRLVVLISAIFAAVILILYLSNIQKNLTTPIVRMAESSDAFLNRMRSHAEPEDLSYEEVPIRSDSELKLLADNVKSLADGVASYMINLKAVTAEKERIGVELSLATKIQASALPHTFPAFPERSDFDIYASMDPAKEVGGDFYDYFLIDSDHLCLVMADVSGKGIPGALFMMASKIVLKSLAMTGLSPSEVLQQANEVICSGNEAQMFVTVWLGILELSTGTLIAANAGHEYPALRQPGTSFALYRDKHGFVVGGMEGVRYKEYELRLEPGSKLFVYTDGLPEATNAAKEMFGTERMLEAINAAAEDSPQEILESVRGSVDRFVKEAEQFDDLTMLCIEYKGA